MGCTSCADSLRSRFRPFPLARCAPWAGVAGSWTRRAPPEAAPMRPTKRPASAVRKQRQQARPLLRQMPATAATVPTEVPASARRRRPAKARSSSPVRACAAMSAIAPTRSRSSIPRSKLAEGKLDTAEVLQTLAARGRLDPDHVGLSTNFVVNGGEGVQTIRFAALAPTARWCCSTAAAPARPASAAAFRRSTSTSFRSMPSSRSKSSRPAPRRSTVRTPSRASST